MVNKRERDDGHQFQGCPFPQRGHSHGCPLVLGSHPTRTRTLVAHASAALRAAKGEPRVLACGVPARHSPIRTKVSAAAMARGGRCVSACPLSHACPRPHRRLPCTWGKAPHTVGRGRWCQDGRRPASSGSRPGTRHGPPAGLLQGLERGRGGEGHGGAPALWTPWHQGSAGIAIVTRSSATHLHGDARDIRPQGPCWVWAR